MPGRGQNRTAAMPQHAGWWRDGINNRLVAVFGGTEIFDFDGNDIAIAQATVFSGAVTLPAGQSATGGFTVSTGDLNDTAGNLRLGAISAFATTEPTSAVVMKQGTAPVGAIATSGGLFSTATVVQKIIAAGTVTNVET